MKNLLVSLLLAFVLSASAAAADKPIKLTGMNTVVMDVEINKATADLTIKALTAVSIFAKGEPVYLLLVSPGGELDAAMSLKESIAQLPNLTVICKYCASAAGMLFVTAKHRLAIANSEFMAHEPYIQHVNANMLADTAGMTSFLEDSYQFNLAEATGMKMTIDMYLNKIRSQPEEMWTLKGNELVLNHAADKLVSLDCDAYMRALAPKSCSGK